MNREYDFTNDTAFGPFYTDEKSIWKRYYLYKNRVGAYDPDSMSYKLQKIYRKLWGDDWPDYMMAGKYAYEKTDGIYDNIYKKNTLESNDKIPSICGDTLNTPTTALNGLFSSVGLNYVKEQTIFYLCTDCKDEELEKKLRALEKDPAIQGKTPSLIDSIIEYFKAWHLLGNFMPVPAGFNCGRYPATFDFFDVTLDLIYDWYLYWDESKILGTLISGRTPAEREIAIENTRRWLSSFQEDGKPSWQAFVEKNYLGAFVEKTEDGNYGMPKEFWVGHLDSQIMPGNFDEYRQFFINATRCIRERNTEMYDALDSESTC